MICNEVTHRIIYNREYKKGVQRAECALIIGQIN